jgi:hypothetical protein
LIRCRKNRKLILRLLLTILSICLITIKLNAQVEQIKLNAGTEPVDSLRQAKLQKLDSAQWVLDKASGKIQSITSIPPIPDSLNVVHRAQHTVDQSELKIDSTKQKLEQKLKATPQKLTSKFDQVKMPTVSGNKYLDKIDSVNQFDPNSKLPDPATKLNGAQTKLDKLQQAPEGQVNEKLSMLSKESYGKGNLPSDVTMPDAKVGAGKVDLPNINTPAIEKPAMPKVDNPLNKNVLDNTNLLDKDINTNVNLEGKLKEKVDIDKLKEIKNPAGDVGEITEKTSGYVSDAKNISKGNVDEVKTLKEDAMKKASLEKEMGVLKEGEQVINDQKAQLAAMKNQEAYREKMMAKGRAMVIKQLAICEQQLQSSVNKVSKYQRTAGTILSKKGDLPKKRDALKRLKKHEKFVPGLTFQTYKTQAWMIDINPSMRYRLTSYWSVGTGWNERIAFNRSLLLPTQTRFFGVRSFTEVVIFKGFSMRLDAEAMNSFVAPSYQHKDEGYRKWLWNYMAGIKKDFTFVPKVMGNVQFMYNLYTHYNHGPYPTRFNVRFGFEYSLKKRIRK